MQPDLFMHSQSSVRDDYKSFNLGSRNGAVCNVSCATATQRLEEMGLQSEATMTFAPPAPASIAIAFLQPLSKEVRGPSWWSRCRTS